MPISPPVTRAGGGGLIPCQQGHQLPSPSVISSLLQFLFRLFFWLAVRLSLEKILTVKKKVSEANQSEK
jgi:hypothetical protein